MNKKRLLYILPFFIVILSFYGCKKENSKPTTLIGSWELKEIYLSETNKTYPLDSFRNINSASITFNSDSSFAKTDNFGRVQIAPLSNSTTSLIELYDKPRHAKARFVIYNGYEELPITSSKFSVKGNIINFETAYKDANTTRSNKFFNQFELKNNSELEIYNENSMIYNQQSNSFFSSKMKFIYKRKNF
ncbi:MAG: hypothetical protein REI64_02650 [Pedobacter sp.]|uniref:hypothetical protein n=1 Tax=Pedobacter sp. TaxID=1411316 RepID=UPI0028091C9F|nr:hypothetical protein [Pedobacter sp.]MDQ8003669.1 hypothetical protein [Pedobacter sp.]